MNTKPTLVLRLSGALLLCALIVPARLSAEEKARNWTDRTGRVIKASILDANVTTLITAAILFLKASGPIKGFAISLTLGILASLFTALIVGRSLFSWFVDTDKVKSVSMLHLISSKNINFLGKGFIATMCSVALLIAGATALSCGQTRTTSPKAMVG